MNRYARKICHIPYRVEQDVDSKVNFNHICKESEMRLNKRGKRRQ